MENEQGITLTSLVIYIIITIIVISILATIMAYFSSNVREFNKSNTEVVELDKFYAFFIKEIKRTNNSVNTIADDNKSITFTSGNMYSFSNEGIYLNTKIKIAGNIENCIFQQIEENGKNAVVTSITIGGKTYTNSFAMNNKTQNIALVNEEDYTHIVLPEEYQKVEYIESNGKQYIDTGFIPNQDTRMLADFQYLKKKQGYRFAGTQGTSGTFRFGTSVGIYWLVGYGANKTTYRVGTCDTNRHKLDFNRNNVYLDNVLLYNFSYQQFTGYGNAYIFSVNSDNIDDLTPAKLYSFKIYDDDQIVRNFVPCYRKSDDKPGLYDMVSGNFYTNSGTEDFTVGPDV